MHSHIHNCPTIETPNVGILKYLKEPALTINELYTRYPAGGEYGWFAFVFSEKDFVWWNHETKAWQTIEELDVEEINADIKEIKELLSQSQPGENISTTISSTSPENPVEKDVWISTKTGIKYTFVDSATPVEF